MRFQESIQAICALVLCVLAASCDSRVLTDLCDERCGSSEFCCLTECKPLGSACGTSSDTGSSDAGGSDADIPDVPDADAPDGAPLRPGERCVPGESESSVDSICAGERMLYLCGAEEYTVCNYACAEWVDFATDERRAQCVLAGEANVCDLEAGDRSYCDGALLYVCVGALRSPGQPQPPGQPPGHWSVRDCTEWAPDGVCERASDDHLFCVSPSDVPCSRASFDDDCALFCQDADGPRDGVLRPTQCPSSAPVCVDNEWTQDETQGFGAARGVACLGADATPSGSPGSSAKVRLGCVGRGRIRYEQFGYTFTEACPSDLRLVGGVAVEVPTVCYDPPPGDLLARCVDEGYETCDPTEEAVCLSATVRRTCSPSNWLRESVSCEVYNTYGTRLVPGAGFCEAHTGECVSRGWCGDFAGGGAGYCYGTSSQWACELFDGDYYFILRPCAGCTERADGSGVDCSG